MSGMGADARVFSKQIEALPQITVPEWIDPLPKESLASYSKRLAKAIDPGRPCYIGGASFGGFIALEMIQHLDVKACFLIGGLSASVVTYKPGTVTNLVQYSGGTFAPSTVSSYWQTTLNASGTAATDNTIAAPLSSSVNASTLTEVAATSSHHIHQRVGDVSAVVGASYTMSCWVKQPSTNAIRYVQLAFWNVGFGLNAYVNFDLQTATIAGSGSSITNAQITPYENGWYRISATAPATATGSSGFQLAFVTTPNGARSESYTASAPLKSLYIWGAQLETGKFVNVYVPTSGAVATNFATVLSETKIMVGANKAQTFPLRVWGAKMDTGITGGSIS
jgi:hypothetical protein